MVWETVDQSVINWIEQRLTGMRQRVVVDGEVSSWKSVLSGVPQYSFLGPILFLVYINALEEGVTSGMLTPRNPKMPKKTDQADQTVQTDHLTGHATDQTFFTFSVEFVSHLPHLPLFTFSVECNYFTLA